MKTRNLLLPVLFASLFVTSCKKDSANTAAPKKSEDVTASVSNNAGFENVGGRQATTAVCNADAYVITLESVTYTSDAWEWIWSVQNPNPGNGTNGTVQDLSHWGMQFGSCVLLSNITGAAYSADNTNWTSFTPSYTVDPSQGCFTSAVLKFDFGTTGSNKSYYKLVVNQPYQAGLASGYFKSGNRTGCCTFSFPGISCGGVNPEE